MVQVGPWLRQAIQWIRTRLFVPWAALQFSLGITYYRLSKGDRADHIERAIRAYKRALQIYSPEMTPQSWAMVQSNLGAAYGNRIRGNALNNVERAITAYRNALKIYTLESDPQDWAMTQHNLATAYRCRIKGQRAENLEQARQACENALRVYTEENTPNNWAMTQNNLAVVYRKRIRGKRAENIEQAIIAGENALKACTRETAPEVWGMTQNSLGNAYADRINGKQAENIEQAILAFERALRVRTREADPQGWAKSQNNLGNAYKQRILGNPVKNVGKAITAYRNSLQVYTKEAAPQDWAMAQGNLAGALAQLSSLSNEPPSQLDEAINLFEATLPFAAPTTESYINNQYRLGHALAQRYEKYKNTRDLRRALTAYRAALNSLSPEHYEHETFANILPQTQTILGSRLVRDGQWQEGLKLLLTSLETLRQTSQPLTQNLSQATALYEIGRAYEILSDWPNARLYYRDALRLFEDQADDIGTARSRSGLGSILVSQGFFDKGIHHLTAAQETLTQLDLGEEVDKVNKLIQAAKAAKAHQLAQKI